MMDSAFEGFEKYKKYHIPPFSLYRSNHGKYGLRNGNGDVISKANLSSSTVPGFEHCLEDDRGNVFEFDPSEGLIPIEIFEEDEMPHFDTEEEFLRHYKARPLEEVDELIT